MPHDVNQMLVNATRCLTAADVLVDSAELRAEHLPFLLPVTLTIGNGLELLFKYNLVRQGQSLALLRERYGRDVFRLWKQPESAAIRLMALGNFAHAADTLPGVFVGADHHDDGRPVAELEHYLKTLARVLQSVQLRAAAEPEEVTCCPRLLAVLPVRHGEGIGSALIAEAILRLRASCKGAALVGDPGYYSRFGFRTFPGLRAGDCPQQFVQALPFTASEPEGELIHHSAFGLQQRV